jgi:hypothetical protein
LWPTAEHLTPLGRNKIPLWVWEALGAIGPSASHVWAVQLAAGALAGIRKSLKMYCFYYVPGRIDYFLSFLRSFIIMVNHVQIVFT